ncbi:MAG TPA: RNA polymerase sigma factor SigM [Kineosporiaceae bacterium]|nr:RNA polymerase sigma factor SigM [Kineosporiaceae bacterium]
MNDDGEPDDRRLLADHLAGNPDAFTTLVRRHRDRLWAVALRTTGDPEDAADALQDALISALRGAAGYRGDAAVTTWLHRVVINASLDRIRRRQARPAVPLDGHELQSRTDDHAATVTRLDIRAALARLPEPQRVALILVDLEDMSVAETAQILEVPEGTVKSRCSRARTAMAVMLRDVGTSRPVEGGNRTDTQHVQAGESLTRRPGSGEGW